MEEQLVPTCVISRSLLIGRPCAGSVGLDQQACWSMQSPGPPLRHRYPKLAAGPIGMRPDRYPGVLPFPPALAARVKAKDP